MKTKKVEKKEVAKEVVKEVKREEPKALHPFQIAAKMLSGNSNLESCLNPDLKTMIQEYVSISGDVSQNGVAAIIVVWRRLKPQETALYNPA